jgi:hypothetical protein
MSWETYDPNPEDPALGALVSLILAVVVTCALVALCSLF